MLSFREDNNPVGKENDRKIVYLWVSRFDKNKPVNNRLPSLSTWSHEGPNKRFQSWIVHRRSERRIEFSSRSQHQNATLPKVSIEDRSWSVEKTDKNPRVGRDGILVTSHLYICTLLDISQCWDNWQQRWQKSSSVRGWNWHFPHHFQCSNFHC